MFAHLPRLPEMAASMRGQHCESLPQAQMQQPQERRRHFGAGQVKPVCFVQPAQNVFMCPVKLGNNLRSRQVRRWSDHLGILQLEFWRPAQSCARTNCPPSHT